MESSTISRTKRKGGSFLIEPTGPEEIYSPEDFTEEHRAIARTTEEFWIKEIVPHVDAMQHQEPGVAVSILRKAGALGLTSVHLPEKYGGMEMDLTSAMLVDEGVAKDGSYAAWHGGQSGIGALPLLLFGTEEQKQRYLPRVATAELVAAYALSEPQAGSDALAARTRADLSPDGKHYTLNGQKMWITNGGAADLFTIFAKIGGEKFTAFLVERKFPGLSSGAEEKKMGIKGSSTTAIYLDNVPVPIENVLGEIGRGHIIAFNILNIGRLKLGAFACGGAKEVLRVSLKYAQERKAFGKPISEFGLIQHKLAEMAIRIFANESATYRVVGLIESQLEGFSWDQPDAARTELKAVEEFAAECSYIKIFASEMLDYVTDEGVQIHGGYGFHQDYAVERAYRDSRINRIFEGTNEINRLLATGMLLKRAQRGQLPLVEAVKKLQSEILAGPSLASTFTEDARLVENAKKIALFTLGVAYQKFSAALEDQEEVLAAITDISMNAFVMESVLLRTQRLANLHQGEIAADACPVFLREAMETIESAARNALAACAEGDAMRTNLAVLKRFTKFEPVNAIAARRRIAQRLLTAGHYLV
ncbi:MAG TPA: acyl-CoA dehydrogenase family protein [Bryobacteraceae bacterium]|nr:acyl-CoA dehydrogenase family protein [Bryobacteraceae bacterium]